MEDLMKHLQRRLENKKEHYDNQQRQLEKIEWIQQNTQDVINQIKYAAVELERIQRTNRKPREIPHEEIMNFFMHLRWVFDRFQHRYHMMLDYQTFCVLVAARYQIKSRYNVPGKEYIGHDTILTYFKQERGMFEEI